MAKEAAVTIRVTEEQKSELEKQAKIHGVSVSQYSREKLFENLPVNASINILDLKSALLDTQKYINEIARACCSSNTFSQTDYQKVMSLMKKIDAKYYELIREIKRSNALEYQKIIGSVRQQEEGKSDGDYKTDQNQGSSERR